MTAVEHIGVDELAVGARCAQRAYDEARRAWSAVEAREHLLRTKDIYEDAEGVKHDLSGWPDGQRDSAAAAIAESELAAEKVDAARRLKQAERELRPALINHANAKLAPLAAEHTAAAAAVREQVNELEEIAALVVATLWRLGDASASERAIARRMADVAREGLLGVAERQQVDRLEAGGLIPQRLDESGVAATTSIPETNLLGFGTESAALIGVWQSLAQAGVDGPWKGRGRLTDEASQQVERIYGPILRGDED